MVAHDRVCRQLDCFANLMYHFCASIWLQEWSQPYWNTYTERRTVFTNHSRPFGLFVKLPCHIVSTQIIPFTVPYTVCIPTWRFCAINQWQTNECGPLSKLPQEKFFQWKPWRKNTKILYNHSSLSCICVCCKPIIPLLPFSSSN